MAESPERRKYYPDEEETPLSVAVLDAVEAHENASLSADQFRLYEHVNPDAIDQLFTGTAGVDISVQIHLDNVTVSIWSDRGIDIRVTDRID